MLLGAVGSPAYDKNPGHLRPEAGLLRLRKELGAFANLRPAKCFSALLNNLAAAAGSGARHRHHDRARAFWAEHLFRAATLDRRALLGSREAVNTMRYGEKEIERIARVAFELARKRKGKVLSVDKANVLECSRLWREVVTLRRRRVSRREAGAPICGLGGHAAGAASKETSTCCSRRTCLATFCRTRAGGLVGGLGMLPSASIGGSAVGLYEPVHGSAPDIAGQELRIRWEPFCRPPCCSGIRSVGAGGGLH